MDYSSDSHCIQDVKKGDPAAFEYIVNRHKNYVYNLAFNILRNKEDAEEASQDSFLKAFQNLSDFEGKSKFTTWLYRIVYNTCISRLRKNKLKTESIENNTKIEFDLNWNDNVFEKIELEDRRKFISEGLDKLNTTERSILILFYLNEYTINEISKITGYSISNVKVRLHRARKNLYSHIVSILDTEFSSLI
ncbi:MAG: RNA polymerase sigma factor [Marinifilaceae bacterium]|jgi:RNA polymerase sigma-70 factor (ECF subfamily)|nr:RNA polymerase sigma factor [Marinifilaceae bacterium]